MPPEGVHLSRQTWRATVLPKEQRSRGLALAALRDHAAVSPDALRRRELWRDRNVGVAAPARR